MIKLNNNKGITLIVLVITIIVILIITGITITLSIDSINQTVESQDLSEMLIVQHAIQEKYVQYLETNDESKLIGKTIGSINSDHLISSKHKFKISKKSENSLEMLACRGMIVTRISDFLVQRIKITDDNYKFIICKEENNESVLEQANSGNGEKIKSVKKIGEFTNFEINNFTELEGKLTSTDEVNSVWKKINDDPETYEAIITEDFTEDANQLILEVDDFSLLGITGNSIINSTFKVNYQTGYVEKVGSSTSPLKGYNQDTSGNTTSHEVSITN